MLNQINEIGWIEKMLWPFLCSHVYTFFFVENQRLNWVLYIFIIHLNRRTARRSVPVYILNIESSFTSSMWTLRVSRLRVDRSNSLIRFRLFLNMRNLKQYIMWFHIKAVSHSVRRREIQCVKCVQSWEIILIVIFFYWCCVSRIMAGSIIILNKKM